ncbi:MAG: fumarylacetoacetate hydrolase family protein [Oscillospiraceae bacterium]|nr:fumarylacetoacetate hydrolase family protein [Oscillospiraceae bacterium]
MRIVRFEYNDGKKKTVLYGKIVGDKISVCEYLNKEKSCDTDFLRFTETGEILPISDQTDNIVILSPSMPSKIVAVGKCYKEHIAEIGGEVPETPVIFLKPPSSVNHHLGNIRIPNGFGRIDYEGELAFIISQKASSVKASDAHNYILGYTCFNDVTARDIQKIDGQWTRAKGFDTFAPFGPWIETEVDPMCLNIRTVRNGKTVQKANTSDMRWNVYEQLEFITSCMTLMPGDVVTTGTPSGIGEIKAGDIIEVEIEGIGILKNFVTIK